MTANFQADASGFRDMINRRAIVFGISRKEAFKTESRLLALELMDRTPPFSSKSIQRMLGAQGKSVSTKVWDEIGGMTARKVGENAVEKDIRRVIHGVRGAKWPEETPTVIVSQTNPRQARHSNKLEFGILQKVKGKSAVRVYADKKGNVYGVDTELFQPKASLADLEKMHRMARTKRGTVSRAGKSDLITGRWKWINKLVTKTATLNKYIRKKKANVGRAKGGWAASFMRFGGRMSIGGWVGRHARKTGRVQSTITNDKIDILMINRSEWARGGDYDRIIPKALSGRAEALKGAIKRQMLEDWKKAQTK